MGGIDVVALRRDFHRHPELGFTEFRTASRVVQLLAERGFQVRYGRAALDSASRRGVPPAELVEAAYQRALQEGADPTIVAAMRGGLTGVVATLTGSRPGPVLGMRFDMDALPIAERDAADHRPAALGFRSAHDGVMHACGHDGHTAIGVALADRLAAGDFAGTLKLVFQPAEEGVRGARAMAEAGVVDDVDVLLCLHLGVDVPLGELCAGSAGGMATTKLQVRFVGQASHASAAPEHGRNALLGAATALLNIHALPRFATTDTRVNVGLLEGGTASNVIAQRARMLVETRAADSAVNAELERRVRAIVASSARMHDLEHEIEVTGEAAAIVCDPEVMAVVLDEARGVEGLTSLKELHRDTASDDASLLMDRVRACGGKATYMVVGTTLAAPHHQDRFDIDEQALPIAVDLLERLARRFLRK